MNIVPSLVQPHEWIGQKMDVDGCEPNSLFYGTDASSSSNWTKQKTTSHRKHWQRPLELNALRLTKPHWKLSKMYPLNIIFFFLSGQKQPRFSAIYRCKQTGNDVIEMGKIRFLFRRICYGSTVSVHKTASAQTHHYSAHWFSNFENASKMVWVVAWMWFVLKLELMQRHAFVELNATLPIGWNECVQHAKWDLVRLS